MAIDYSEKIPNNVDLSSNQTLQRALEHWQPAFLQWWSEMGPDKSQMMDVYLRTAVSVEAKGWAHFDYVKMPDYRWGIFLAPAEPERKISFGAHKGESQIYPRGVEHWKVLTDRNIARPIKLRIP